MKPSDRYQDIKRMLEDLENPYKRLTDWEESFYESISEQFGNTGSISDKQYEILQRIRTEKTR